MKRVLVSVTSLTAQKRGRVKNDMALYQAMPQSVWSRTCRDITDAIANVMVCLHGTIACVKVPNDNWAHYSPDWRQIKRAFYA